MADLTSLFQYAPTMAGMFTGQNQANKRTNDQLTNQNLAQEIQFAAQKHAADLQMNPLKQRNQELVNQGLEAGLGGIRATSEGKALEVKKAQETYDSDVEATKAVNKGKVGDEADKARERATKFLLEAGPQLEAVPAPMRAAAFRQMMEESKMNLKNAQLQQMLAMAQQDPNNFPKAVAQIADRLGQQAMQMNPAARASIENNKRTTSTQLQIAREGDATQKEVANIQAASRKANSKNKAEDIRTKVMTGELSTDKAIAAAIANEQFAETFEEKMVWRQLANTLSTHIYNKPLGGQQGRMGLGPDGTLTPRTVKPLYPDQPKRGTGTKDDPIKLD
jgi:hypothetical protein